LHQSARFVVGGDSNGGGGGGGYNANKW
jgi:hypothetical protein